MGPIEKKISEYLSLEGLSNETEMILKSLVKEITPIEKTIINNAYFKGYSDKEFQRSPIWDQYSNNYKKYSILNRLGENN